MSKEDKKFYEAYKSIDVRDVDLEARIIEKIEKQVHGPEFNMRVVIVTCLLIVFTTSVIYAVSQIIHHEDGSHTLVSENEETSITVIAQSEEDTFTYDEREMFNKVMKELVPIQIEGDQAKFGYLKYSEDQEPIFGVLAAGESYGYTEENKAVILGKSDVPYYLSDIIAELEKVFNINKVKFDYSVDEQTREEVLEICEQKSVFGQVYTDVKDVDKILYNVDISLLSQDMDKFYNTSVSLSDNGLVLSPGSNETDYETISIGDRVAMLSKRTDGKYILVVEVDGTGLIVTTDPRGDVNNLYDLTENLIDVLEDQE